MQAYKKDEESGVGQFFQDKTVSFRANTELLSSIASVYLVWELRVASAGHDQGSGPILQLVPEL